MASPSFVIRTPGERSCLTHQADLGKLGNRWLEVRWHRPHKSIIGNEAVHAANRAKHAPIKLAA